MPLQLAQELWEKLLICHVYDECAPKEILVKGLLQTIRQMHVIILENLQKLGAVANDVSRQVVDKTEAAAPPGEQPHTHANIQGNSNDYRSNRRRGAINNTGPLSNTSP